MTLWIFWALDAALTTIVVAMALNGYTFADLSFVLAVAWWMLVLSGHAGQLGISYSIAHKYKRAIASAILSMMICIGTTVICLSFPTSDVGFVFGCAVGFIFINGERIYKIVHKMKRKDEEGKT